MTRTWTPDEPITIVLATDGTEASADARAAAAHIARAGKSALHVVHVWTQFAPPRDAESRVDEAMIRAVADAEAEVLKEQLGCPVAGVHTPRGYRAASILRVAARVGAGLVIVGGRKLGIVEELFTYRVSEGVVRESHSPVLLVPAGGPPWPPHHIIVGCDGSPEAKRVVQVAGWLAGITDADVLIARIVAPGSEPDVRRAAEQDLEACAQAVGESGSSRGISTRVTSDDDVPAALRRITADLDQAPLLAIGARGSGARRRAGHLGVSRAIIHHTRSPILFVPRPLPH